MMNQSKDEIKKYSGAIARGLISQIPGIGSVAVELLNTTIPNQRQERIEKLLNILALKVFEINQEDLQERFQSSDFIDIYQDVLFQTVRATTDQRIEYLASVLEKGLKDQEFDHITNKRLIEILEKINDIEVIILQSYALYDISRETFIEKHNEIFKVGNTKPQTDEDRQARQMFNHYLDNLISLGLIGYIAATSIHPIYQISATELGHMLIELIGLEHNGIFRGESLTALDVLNKLQQKEKEINKNIDKAKKELESFSNKALNQMESELKKVSRTIYSSFKIR